MNNFDRGNSRLIVIYSSYKANTAPTNRLLSFLKGFDEHGMNVEMVFIYPNYDRSRIDETYQNINVKYLWDGHRKGGKLLKYIRSFWDVWRYVRKISEGSNVFIYGSKEYVPFFTKRKNIRVFHERTEHYNVVKIHPSFWQKVYQKSLSKLKGMFVISTALRNAYLQAGVRNVEIVNMTVDSTRFVDLKKQPQETKYVAYCGTASNNKDGVDDLIRAFAIVHKEVPSLKLLIIGRAPAQGDESGNVELVHQLGLKDSVVFKGIVPAAQMPQILKNAEILALARPDSLQARYGFPTKLGEYLLTENPVVVTKVGDIPLFLKDGKSALLAEQHNPEDFAAKMLWAFNHEEEARMIGQEGAKVAMREFNYKIETEKIINTIFSEGR